jgi:large subunit ribosomal protein L25
MSKALELTVTKRDVIGKKVAVLRRQGLVVGNIFSKGSESTAIQVDYETIRKMVDAAGFNHPINMKVEGAGEHLVLIKDIDRDPRTNRFHHIAFHEVRRDQKVEAQIPVELVGTSPAILVGNIILTLNDTVLVSANPMSLPDHFEADATHLAEPDDHIQAKDLKLPEGVELVDDLETVLFKVDVPRAQVEEESEASEADAVAATLEASGEVKPDTEDK